MTDIDSDKLYDYIIKLEKESYQYLSVPGFPDDETMEILFSKDTHPILRERERNLIAGHIGRAQRQAWHQGRLLSLDFIKDFIKEDNKK